MFRKSQNTAIEESDLKKVNILAQIKMIDEYFNEANFLSWAQNIFLKLKNAFVERNIEAIKELETKELFLEHSNQIRQYLENKQIKMADKIAVNSLE